MVSALLSINLFSSQDGTRESAEEPLQREGKQVVTGFSLCNLQSDVYAFGVLFFEILTRADPFPNVGLVSPCT